MITGRIVSFIVCSAFAQAAAAQVPVTNSCPADAPVALQVAAIKPDAELASVTITNKGPKALSAVFLRWQITDSSGATLPSVSTVDTATSGELLAPGASVTTEGSVTVSENKSLKAVEVTCIAVLFTGKGVWGDHSIPEIPRLMGIRTGIKSERTRLLRIYENQGSDKLLKELKRP